MTMLHTSPAANAFQTNKLVEVMASSFSGTSGTLEYNFILKPVVTGSFDEQLAWLDTALQAALLEHRLDQRCIVFRRIFCADLPGHAEALQRHAMADDGGTSVVIQPPVGPATLAMWVYCVADESRHVYVSGNGSSFSLRRNGLEHVWSSGLACPDQHGSRDQTLAVFDSYIEFLGQRGMTLQDNCLRTWFYVADVDNNYDGLVDARNEVFQRCGLTPETHYIASTGIQGSGIDPKALVMMDAYAIKGVQAEQVRHLKALDHLSDTHVYGVAFERATQVAYRDRRHIIISGTASIDSSGAVVHDGDVGRQLDRTLENIAALLARADATLDDMQHFIVYVRKSADVHTVNDALARCLGSKPFLVVTGPVCRPDWLVEVEGIAITANDDPSLPEF